MSSVNKDLKEKIIKDTAKYNFAQYGSQFFGFFSAMAMRKFLGPYFVGVWSLLGVIMDSCNLMDLGVGTAATYKIPFFKGKQDDQAQKDITNSAFSFILITSSFASAMVLIAAFILRNKHPKTIIAGLIIASFYMLLRKLYSYYIVVLRANSNFYVINRAVIFDAIVNLILILLLVKNFKIYGLYVTVILMAVFNISFMHYFAKYKILFALKKDVVRSLLQYGFPLLILGILGATLRSIDRIMIAKMLGVTFVGYYSLAIMAKNYVGGFSNNFGIVTIPRILEAYGKEEKIEHIKKFVTVSAEIISYLLPVLLGVIFLACPLFVSKVLPKFIPGILAVQILLLDIFFRSCSPQADQFIVALGKQSRIIPINIITILINVVLNYTLIKKGYGIYGVALGTAVASFFNFIVILIYAMKHFANAKEILVFIGRIMFPIAYISAVVVISTYFINIGNPYIRLIINLSILFIAAVPLFFYIDRRTRILRIMFNFLSKGKART